MTSRWQKTNKRKMNERENEWQKLKKDTLHQLDTQLASIYKSLDKTKFDVFKEQYDEMNKSIKNLLTVMKETYSKVCGEEDLNGLSQQLFDRYNQVILDKIDAQNVLGKNETADRKNLEDDENFRRGSLEEEFKTGEKLHTTAKDETLGRGEWEAAEDFARSMLEKKINEEVGALKKAPPALNKKKSSLKVAFDEGLIEVAMVSAINSKSTLHSNKNEKRFKLSELLVDYDLAQGRNKKEVLREFIRVASTPRETMFFKAKFGETASAEAFFKTLKDEKLRTAVSNVLGLKEPLPEPTGKNLKVFADAVRAAFVDELSQATPKPKK